MSERKSGKDEKEPFFPPRPVVAETETAAKEAAAAAAGKYELDAIAAWFKANEQNESLWHAINVLRDWSGVPRAVRDLFERAVQQSGHSGERGGAGGGNEVFLSRFGVFVAPSSIEGAGLGLFALRTWQPGEVIASPYAGATIPEAEFDCRWSDPKDAAILQRKERYLYGFNVDFGARRFSVDPTDPLGRLYPAQWSENTLPYANEPPLGVVANADFADNDDPDASIFDHVLLRACSPIAPLTEIFTCYFYALAAPYSSGRPCPALPDTETKVERPGSGTGKPLTVWYTGAGTEVEPLQRSCSKAKPGAARLGEPPNAPTPASAPIPVLPACSRQGLQCLAAGEYPVNDELFLQVQPQPEAKRGKAKAEAAVGAGASAGQAQPSPAGVRAVLRHVSGAQRAVRVGAVCLQYQVAAGRARGSVAVVVRSRAFGDRSANTGDLLSAGRAFTNPICVEDVLLMTDDAIEVTADDGHGTYGSLALFNIVPEPCALPSLQPFLQRLAYTIEPRPTADGRFVWPELWVQRRQTRGVLGVVHVSYGVFARTSLEVGTRIPRLGVPVPRAVYESRRRAIFAAGASATTSATATAPQQEAGGGAATVSYLFETSQGYFDGNPAFAPSGWAGGHGAFITVLMRSTTEARFANAEEADTDYRVTQPVEVPREGELVELVVLRKPTGVRAFW